MLWSLFLTFCKIGLVSFGGGYAMIPLIEYEVLQHEWLTPQQLTDAIAIAGMSPGPIATNIAIFVGYKIEGVLGAILATVAISLPSLILVLLITVFLSNVRKHGVIQAAFYGLRPVIAGLIFFAAVRFALHNQLIGGERIVDGTGVILTLGALAALLLAKMHPLIVIVLSGIVGVVLYY